MLKDYFIKMVNSNKTTFHNLVALCFLFMVILNGCAVRKQSSDRTVTVKESFIENIDTAYYGGEVNVSIKGDTAQGSEKLYINEEAFNRYIDSLFAAIDTMPETKYIYFTQYINRIKGLWDSDTSFLKTDFAKSQAFVFSGEMYHNLIQADTNWKAKYDSLNQVVTKDRLEYHSKEVIEKKTRKSRSGFSMFWIGIIVTLVVEIVGYIVLKKFRII